MIKRSLGNWDGLSTHTQFLKFVAFLKYVGLLKQINVWINLSYPPHNYFTYHLAIFFTSFCFCCSKNVLISNFWFLLFKMFLFPILCPGATTKLGAFILLTVAFVMAIVLLLNLCFLYYFLKYWLEHLLLTWLFIFVFTNLRFKFVKNRLKNFFDRVSYSISWVLFLRIFQKFV